MSTEKMGSLWRFGLGIPSNQLGETNFDRFDSVEREKDSMNAGVDLDCAI